VRPRLAGEESVRPKDDNAKCEKPAGLTASVKVKENLEHVSAAFETVIHGSRIQDFEYSTPLTGHVNVDWAVLTMQPDSGIGESRLKFVPCCMTHLNFYAQAGADAILLAMKGEAPKLTIQETKITTRKPDIDACRPK
jgi:hypothetical protein